MHKYIHEEKEIKENNSKRHGIQAILVASALMMNEGLHFAEPSTQSHSPMKSLVQLRFGLRLSKNSEVKLNIIWDTAKQVSPSRTPNTELHVGVTVARFFAFPNAAA